MTNTLKKGFTLVELLIVIAVLAILIAAVIIVLNPGEILAQARDSQRVSDMSSIKSALSLYIIQSSVPPFAASSCAAGGICTKNTTAGGPFANATCAATSTTSNVIGSGWVDVAFSTVPGGSPLPFLPVDPSNGDTYFYAFMCDKTANTFELDAKLESVKYGNNTTGLQLTDGGSNTAFYEIGTAPGLAL